MKIKFHLRATLALAFGLALAGSIRAQTVLINLTGATLYDAGGVPLVDGRLIQLVASTTDLTFSRPTPTSFVSGDDVVLASFGLDSSILGQPGSFQVALNIDTSLFPSLTAGDPLLLRWFDIDYAPGQTAPGVTFFGQFRTDSVVDSSDTGWFLPGAGGAIGLNFVTVSNGGSQPEIAGRASAVVPEPATTVAFAALGALAFAAGRRRFLRGGKEAI